MIKTLGEDGFETLKIKALGITKWSTSDLKILLMHYEREYHL